MLDSLFIFLNLKVIIQVFLFNKLQPLSASLKNYKRNISPNLNFMRNSNRFEKLEKVLPPMSTEPAD